MDLTWSGAGDLDVLLSVIPPRSYLDGNVWRLWSDSREAERASAVKHKIFPIMHSGYVAVGLRTALLGGSQFTKGILGSQRALPTSSSSIPMRLR